MRQESVLQALFKNKYGVDADAMHRLPAAGGDRRYYRLSCRHDGTSLSAIGVVGDNITENHRFIYLSGLLHDKGVNVPEIYCVSDDYKCYLQQDLGSVSMFDRISKARAEGDSEEIERMVCDCMRALPHIQTAGPDYSLLCKPFDRRMIMRDLNYFRYCMLKPSGVDPDEDLIDEDFEALADRMSNVEDAACGFMYRDCQSRNVMMPDGVPYWIDYQGGRKGPVLYDVASFLWQARAELSAQTRERGFRTWLESYCALRPEADAEQLRAELPMYVLLRLLQVLGAYGFRGLIEHRAHFILSIGPAMKNIGELLEDGVCDEYPELHRCLTQLVQIWHDRLSSEDTSPDGKQLTVYVFSFSYKKGYPADYTGNGGGFMFDCRGMHNPGRYEQYKRLTGRDAPVIEFLEERGEVQPFLQAVRDVVTPTVKRYIERGFSSLQIGFGCTGGQHRSVYCAEKMATYLRGQFPQARVLLRHREQ